MTNQEAELSLEEKIEYFMFPFMCELEQELRSRKNELISISFHSDEANTDRSLKEYLKEFIQTKFNKLPEQNVNKKFHINYIHSEKLSFTFSYSYFKDIFIRKVYLPEEITDTIKEQVRKQDSIYTNPDLLLEVTNGGQIFYIPVELKSTKTNVIPGSSVQQVIPTEWVIFIKHTKTDVFVTTGQYIYSINSTMQFPDRSPRPSVSFSELEDWNKSFRTDEKDIFSDEDLLLVTISDNLLQRKIELLKDWQGILVGRWLEVIKKDTVKKNEAWFSNTIRRYTLDFLEMYEGLADSDKEKLKNNIIHSIDLYNKNCTPDSEQ